MLALARIAAAALSGALLAQVYGLAPYWPLAWIAPIPLLAAVIGASAMTAWICGAVAGVLSGALMFGYLAGLAGPLPVILVALFKTLVWAAAALAVRFSARHAPAAAAVFAFPLLLAGIETLTAATSPHGSGGALAYSQMNFLPAIQVAALGGAPAITFVVALFASLAAFLIARRALVATVAPLALVAASLGFGYWRLSLPPQSETVRVALLASDQFSGVPVNWRAVWAAYSPLIERAADADYRVVLLPEKIAALPQAERDVAVALLSEIAERRDIQLIFGADVETDRGLRFNRLYELEPSSPGVIYDKHHLIPGLESHFTPGRQFGAVGEAPRRFGFAICKDMDFPAVGRAYADADIVFAPAWDFRADAWLHSRMAMLRGVENGYAVVRAARDGLLTVSDAYGRVRAEASSGPLTAFYAEAPVDGPGPTLYGRIGDVFGWACLLLAAGVLGWAVVRRRAEQGA